MFSVAKIISVGLLLTFLIFGGWASQILLDVGKDRAALAAVVEKRVSSLQQAEIFSRAMGYNGFIHHYKNYLLRGDESYFTAAQQDLAKAIVVLDELEQYSEAIEEKLAFAAVRETVLLYQKNMAESAVLVRQGLRPSEVDKVSRISDVEAERGIDFAIGALQDRLSGEVAILRNTMDKKVQDIYLLFGLLAIMLLSMTGLAYVLLRLVKSKEKITARFVEADRIAQQMHEAEILGKVGYWALGGEGAILEWSDGIFYIHGRDPAKGTPPLEVAIGDYHPDDREEIKRLIAKAQQDGETFEFQKRIVTGEGQEKTVFVRGEVKRSPSGQVISGVMMDITEQVAIQSEFTAVKQRFELARKAAEIGVWEYDPATQALAWDEGMFQLYGIKEQDFRGIYADWADRVHPDDLGRAEAEVQEAIENYQPFNSRFRVVQPDGTIRWINGRARVFADDQGVANRMIGVNIDITEMVQAEEKVHTALAEAKQANAAKSDFLAVMSHEIRTPLNAIMGMLELLDKDSLPAADQMLVKTALSSSQQLLTVLSDILDMSRIEAGKLEIEARPFNVLWALQQTMSLHNGIAQEKGLKVDYSLPENSPPVLLGDENRIRQIIGNFLSNAIKFTTKGTISVDATVIPATAEETDAVFTIKVTDQGIGIPAEKITALFQPFEQIDGGRTRKYGGTGLGLSICKRLAEAMGGTVGADSEAGKGSTFWLRLVLPISHEAKQAPKRDLKDILLPSLKILAAEDAKPNQFLLINMLQNKLGMDLHIVGNGALALEAVQQDDYDVILMDVQMPVMDGVTATRAIRALQAPCAEIPIIGLTANALTEQQDEYREAGMTFCLTKPIDWRELIITLASLKEPEPETGSEASDETSDEASDENGAPQEQLSDVSPG
ncbi:ATP-binding protein [Kiloniella laminariae]|uniref:histidine kinase n=1 Tax=Kiloniella laminariae TaxID=454162 RepID=A0ABT4LFC8_9PROT|nr:PAS domain-containing protein [Kiloniella laminariae]MCZ4279809.1 ATP-binding protein [Kiloniella laminariae]